jgi:hypothetical protein
VKIHKLAELFPKIEGNAFEELCDDIAKNGLREPIVLLDDEILDGRHRFAACLARGIEPRFTTWFPGEGDSAAAYVISANLHRRHLNDAQRALVAAKLVTAGAVSARWNPDKAVTTVQAGALLNIPKHQVRRARRVLKHGKPETIAAVESGTMTITAAEEIAAPVLKPRKAVNDASDSKIVGSAEPEPAVQREIFDWIEKMYDRQTEIFELIPNERRDLLREFAELVGVAFSGIRALDRDGNIIGWQPAKEDAA